MSVIDWFTIGLTIVAIIWFVKQVAGGADERHAEDDARAFFEEHAHWPDEDPAQGERRRAEAKRVSDAERAWRGA